MFDSADLAVAQQFAIALLVGALVGTERELRKTGEQGFTFGGLRTFILVAQAGALSAWLSLQLGQHWLFVATVVAVSGIVLTSYVLESRLKPDAAGLTTELAAISVCLLGGAVIYGHAALAVALAIVTAAVLAYKQPLHRLVGKIGTDDMYAGLRLLIASFIVLPLLPDRPVDPWQALNPYKLWLLVILISSLSLLGYVAVRWFGSARGTALTGLTGGLVSSTAVSLSFARQSRLDGGTIASGGLAAGVLLAWLVMFVRVLVEVAVVHAALLASLVVPFAIMAAATAGFAVAYYWRGHLEGAHPAAAVPLTNPFSLWEASKFGLLFAVVLLVVKLAEVHFQGGGMYLVAALAGLTDVDAITLSMAEYARRGGDAQVAAGSIVVATLTNTLVKSGMIVVLGSTAMRARMAAATAAILAAGLAALLIT
jgi:uncharacterized membrane protein (DUF4010 family)